MVANPGLGVQEASRILASMEFQSLLVLILRVLCSEWLEILDDEHLGFCCLFSIFVVTGILELEVKMFLRVGLADEFVLVIDFCTRVFLL
jgi:hypothetical protein